MSSFRPGNKPASYQQHTRVALRVHTALVMMRQGTATPNEWRDLSDAVNTVEALSDADKLDIEEIAPLVEVAVDGMVEAMDAYKATKAMQMREGAYDALRLLVNAYDEAIGRFSETTMVKAQAAVVMRIAQAKRSSSSTVVDGS